MPLPRRTPLAACAVIGAIAAVPTASAAPAAAQAVTPSRVEMVQNFAYGRQTTRLAGVLLTRPRGGASFGTPETLLRRLGDPWRCGPAVGNSRSVSWRNGALGLGLVGLQFEPPCDPSSTAVGAVALRTPGQRMVTPFGSVRVGQRWATAPAALRRQERFRTVARQTVLGLGLQQNSCGRAPTGRDRRAPLVQVVLRRPALTVDSIRVTIPISEGVDCG